MVNTNKVTQKGGYSSCGSHVEEEKKGGKRRRSRRRSGSPKKRSRKRRSNKRSGKKSKKGKRSKSKSKRVSKSKCGDNLTNPNFTALCMTCYHRSGKKSKKATMAVKGRECRKMKNGGLMVMGKCVKCGGKMVKLVSKNA